MCLTRHIVTFDNVECLCLPNLQNRVKSSLFEIYRKFAVNFE